MRGFLLLLGCISYCTISIAQPEIRFEEKKQKFGEVKAGQTLSFDFSFTNKGDQPLLISNIKVTCTCTGFEFPKQPVMPGEKGNIHVTFDTKGKTGWQYRTLEVFSNAKGSPSKIQFIGKVIPEKG